MLKHSVLFLALLLSGCMLGPNYQRPSQELPQEFSRLEGWKLAEPAELAERGQWWALFQDEQLAGFLQQLEEQNQSLAASEAAWREARAALGITDSALYPQLSARGGSTRSAEGREDIRKNKNVQLGLDWQLDVWGQVRRQMEAGQARLDASAAEWAAMRLSLQTQLVQNYVQLRLLDEQLRTLAKNVESSSRVLKITQNRYNSGMLTKADVSQALSQFKSLESQYLDVSSQRQRMQNSIAVLLGLPATGFAIAAEQAMPSVPALPQQIPSSLLERRPDIAAAERRVMAANAEIGVAKTAYFPSFSFSASGGYRAAQWSGLVATDNRFWSLGPQFDLRIFDAGARRSKLQQAQAAYDQQVARYRQLTLEAIAEVEDALVQLQLLQEQYSMQNEAYIAAVDALSMIENQYAAGIVDFLSVNTAQNNALSAERTLLDLSARQLTASTQLISALGGGWHTDSASE